MKVTYIDDHTCGNSEGYTSLRESPRELHLCLYMKERTIISAEACSKRAKLAGEKHWGSTKKVAGVMKDSSADICRCCPIYSEE